ncbi:phenylacetate--CoA ligase family protein [Rahnella sp. LAC-M12]|uniref:Phenylacetate--CoA ligase family protein n=1 Tax=Rahnella laticis TaxID=2787622 RepID=A0ABS0EAF6_9GAMM|nr:phenylacetate--CoA ligase family protein [Rahnella laticis]MBF8000477.1 phenylacetate--CoA ligase family protein [Rahnella sp. LAC-M12]
MDANHPFLKFSERLLSQQPFKIIKGLASACIAYPIAERMEKRNVRDKVQELSSFYQIPYLQRKKSVAKRLADIVSFAGRNVPYYRDLFSSNKFDPEKIYNDVRYLQDIPYLTKDIIREQGHRLLSSPLQETRHHVCKTGGSTGLSCFIYYDQQGADYSSAVTLYCRESIGKKKYLSELHFACRFPDATIPEWPSREDFKCFAMNRSNIFFDRIDEQGLEEIWKTLKLRKPFLAHAHPSTIYALACYIENKYGSDKTFSVFESSGELLQPYMREAIEKTLRCSVINRYGLAEIGVIAYELNNNSTDLYVLDSEGFLENRLVDANNEIVVTGYHNKLMPLIRYATGDLATIDERVDGIYLSDIVGRIHDVVKLGGIEYPTHHIQDMLDHRVGGIQEFQIDVRTDMPVLRIVLESNADQTTVHTRLEKFFPGCFDIHFVAHDSFVLVGERAKFRHVVTK